MEEANQNLAERFEFDNQNKTMSMAIFTSSGQKCIQNEKKWFSTCSYLYLCDVFIEILKEKIKQNFTGKNESE